MSTKNSTKARPLAKLTEAACGCGCGKQVTGKAKFRQGHDARMVSQLVAAVVGHDAGSRRGKQAEPIVPPVFDAKTASHITGTADIQDRINTAADIINRHYGQKLGDKASNAMMNGWQRENDRNTNPNRRARKVTQVVKAKVGRWTREGTVSSKGEFQYADKTGKTVTVAKGKFTLAG